MRWEKWQKKEEDVSQEEFEDITAEEIEGLEFTESEMEEFAQEMVESDLEDIEAELMEGAGMEDVATPEAVGKNIIRRIVALIQKIVKKMLSNPVLKRKLKIACKKGTDYVCRLICPVLCKAFPVFLRPICLRLCPIVCKKMGQWICRQAGA